MNNDGGSSKRVCAFLFLFFGFCYCYLGFVFFSFQSINEFFEKGRGGVSCETCIMHNLLYSTLEGSETLTTTTTTTTAVTLDGSCWLLAFCFWLLAFGFGGRRL